MVFLAISDDMGNRQTHSNRDKTKPATAHELETALNSVKITKSTSYRGASTDDFDEVYPGIWISSQHFAKSIGTLSEVGITHVLNCAEGINFMSVRTGASFYKDTTIVYKGINAADVMGYDLSKHFDDCTDFIDEALQKNGKILVHCLQGWSRSVTIVAAYLMLYKGMSGTEALTQIRSNREVHPNPGFLKQLAALDARLYDQRKVAATQST